MNFLIKPFLKGSSGIKLLGKRGFGGGIKATRRLKLLLLSSDIFSLLSTFTVLFFLTLGFLDYC